MEYKIDLGPWGGIFAVPNAVVDRYLKLAGSVQIKALLWVLRHCQEGSLDEHALADFLGISSADANDALRYWQEVGLLQNTQNNQEKKGTERSAAPIKAPVTPSEISAQRIKPTPMLSRPQRPDPEFVAKRIEESQEIACLMQEAQQILGRLISHGDSAVLLMLHDDYGLPTDVLLMLIQYAVSIGKGNFRYIEKVAINWSDEGITTHEQAEEKLHRLCEENRAWRIVEQAIGLQKRAPSARESNLASCWVMDWKFSPQMLKLAYDRNVDRTGKYTAGYMHKILEGWHQKGISTPEQLEQKDSQKYASKASETTHDLDEYFQNSMNEILKEVK
ncbi:DnaD domain protein [Caproicibacterium sp. BJN0003]|uniref:DnaD domain protein n=1 Tax=Caproicibacterium sp. BJN0003 TaxID=2994078 RepID=UPI002259EDC2|nr:DnaD domain protein [Caproicibacterium sp. BJN0003]UZT83207.1 DnaD domain protein [Caproicibacterium sp. BJN0003]